MSLVNDLLIELDRNREGMSRSDADPLEGLSPRKPLAFETKTSIGRVPKAIALIAAGCLGFGVARLDPPKSAAEEFASTDSLSLNEGPMAMNAAGQTKVSALPKVSAPRPSSFEANLRIDRPVALRAVRVEQTDGATRVEIATDRDAEFRIEPGQSEGVFNILLEHATLREPLPILDLFGTAIRSIQTQHEDDGIRLQFTLDSDSRVQSQRLDQAGGTTLIVDFQPAARPRVETIRRAVTKPPKSATVATASYSDASSKRMNAKAKPSQKTDQPQHEMQISRSASDRKRSHREKARQSADRTVESAREAKESGDLEVAARLYSTARETSPDHHDAIVEGVTVLNQLGRVDEALLLIGEARNAQPKNPVYLMVHAKLLAENDLQSAITLLDDSGLSLEAAPEVQALTAAYLQKNGQHDSAIERYEAILRRYPNRPKVWLGLGISLEARGRTVEALDVYRIAMQLGELPGRSRGWISARIDALNQES